jgi:hypothetical protein
MEHVDESKKDGADQGTPTVVKAITAAMFLLYALGWAAAIGWQDGWDPRVRASCGYQLGWVTCLIACAVTLFLRRGHLAQGAALQERDSATTSNNEEEP